jgi:hypothetical protein
MQLHKFSTAALRSFNLRLDRSELCTIRCRVRFIKHICVVHRQNSLSGIGFRFQTGQEFFVVSISPGTDLEPAKPLKPSQI